MGGFGIFVPINHIQKLNPTNDPLQQQSNITIVREQKNMPHRISQSLNKGLIISRGEDPNHLLQGDLFYFLKKNMIKIGMLETVKIGSIDDSIKTSSMISVIFPTANDCIFNYLPLLSENSEYDSIFTPERNVRKKSLVDDDEKEKEHNASIPIVNIWYLNLHETWQKYSNKIKAFGVSDYQSSQWVAQSNQRSLEWYSLLNVSSKNNAKIRFDSAPFPLFLKNKQKEQNEDEMKHQSSQQQSTAFCAISSHYVPLGIFHNQTNDLTNKHKVRWLEASPFSQALFDKQIEFRLKRLVHEPINNMEHILPYLHSQSYKMDATDKEYGYFPIDWVFAEIDFCNEQIEEAFTLCFKNYSPPLVDDQSAYNPFWFMQFPRIPLFVLL